LEVKKSRYFLYCREGDIPEAILKAFLAVDSELKTYGNATELTGSTGTLGLIPIHIVM
jgi:hypothetical protein